MEFKDIMVLIFTSSISAGVFIQIALIYKLEKLVTILSHLAMNMEPYKVVTLETPKVEMKKKITEDQRWRASQKKKEWWAKKKASEAATPETQKESD